MDPSEQVSDTRWHRAGPLVAGVALMMILSGCTTDHGPVNLQPAPTETTEAPPPPAVAVIPTSDATELACAPKRDESKPKISGESQQVPVDGGPRYGATGQALLDSRGVPVAYIVAEDDIPDFIADRFCVGLAYLHNINGPRRGGANDLFAGDTLNLDAETLSTVGDINGEVKDYPLPAPLPTNMNPCSERETRRDV